MRIVGRAAEDATAVRGRSEAVSEDKVGSPESLGLGGYRLELRERERLELLNWDEADTGSVNRRYCSFI